MPTLGLELPTFRLRAPSANHSATTHTHTHTHTHPVAIFSPSGNATRQQSTLQVDGLYKSTHTGNLHGVKLKLKKQKGLTVSNPLWNQNEKKHTVQNKRIGIRQGYCKQYQRDYNKPINVHFVTV